MENKLLTNKLSNFVSSILCYILIPLLPFAVEYGYSVPHHIKLRSLALATTSYAFTGAFSTKYRVSALFQLTIGIFTGAMYGVVSIQEDATLTSIMAYVLYILITMSIYEKFTRHFLENESCSFYTTFTNRLN